MKMMNRDKMESVQNVPYHHKALLYELELDDEELSDPMDP